MIEILGYTLDENNCVSDLGKFEGEPAYVPYLWDQSMNGCEDASLDCDGDSYSVFFVDNAIRSEFPTLDAKDFVVVLWETEQGFVLHETMNQKEYRDFVKTCEASQDSEEE